MDRRKSIVANVHQKPVLWIRITGSGFGFLFDVDPDADPDPNFHPDADLYPDPDPDASFQIKAQPLEKVPK